MSREDELLRQGWTRRFIACEPRLSEAVELYRGTGHEVLLEPVPGPGEAQGEGCGECRICFENDRERYRIIYTRKTGSGVRGGPF